MQVNPQRVIDRGILEVNEFTKVQQVGIDLTLKEDVMMSNGQSLNVLLNETVHLPECMFATFTQRSTYNRMGVIIMGSIYDPGYEGVVGCTIYNMSGADLIIKANERIGQMVFFEADPASQYNGTYQGEHLPDAESAGEKETSDGGPETGSERQDNA